MTGVCAVLPRPRRAARTLALAANWLEKWFPPPGATDLVRLAAACGQHWLCPCTLRISASAPHQQQSAPHHEGYNCKSCNNGGVAKVTLATAVLSALPRDTANASSIPVTSHAPSLMPPKLSSKPRPLLRMCMVLISRRLRCTSCRNCKLNLRILSFCCTRSNLPWYLRCLSCGKLEAKRLNCNIDTRHFDMPHELQAMQNQQSPALDGQIVTLPPP